jgi:histidinol-phosphate/aromatic aminotransferase/cobyric acid decarboxylase-like protein
MFTPGCLCQCKMCRIGGARYCQAHPACGVPRDLAGRTAPVQVPVDPRQVVRSLAALRADSGSHSPGIAQIERCLPGLVRVDACFLANPYASAEVMTRLRAIAPDELHRMVAHYPSQSGSVARVLAPHLAVDPDLLFVANGACEIIHALLSRSSGTLLISVPTFSAYYESAAGPVVTQRLEPHDGFRVDLAELERAVERHHPQTLVIITPNNPDGAAIAGAQLVAFLHRIAGRVEQVIVDESFSHFSTTETPSTVADLVRSLPNLIVVNSLSKSHGIAGLRLGYAVMSPDRVASFRHAALWNLNAFAEWFCLLLGQPGFQVAYERARRRYVLDIRDFVAELTTLTAVTVFPTSANFALMEVDRPASEVVGALLAEHGVYVRDCADKRGLRGDRYIRVAARGAEDNRRVVAGLRDVLSRPVRCSPARTKSVERRRAAHPDPAHADSALVPPLRLPRA